MLRVKRSSVRVWLRYTGRVTWNKGEKRISSGIRIFSIRPVNSFLQGYDKKNRP